MSLNKFPPLVGGEDVGYNLTLNVGCDTLKCNNLEVVGQELVKYESLPAPAPTTFPEGAIAIYKTADVGNTITNTTFAKWELEPTSTSVQFLNMSNANIKNATSILTQVVDPQISISSITGGGSVVVAARQSRVGTVCYGTVGPGSDNCQINGIQLSDEQKARASSYFYDIVADNCVVTLKQAFGTGGNTYDFDLPGGVDYVISPVAGATIRVTMMWRNATETWVLAQ